VASAERSDGQTNLLARDFQKERFVLSHETEPPFSLTNDLVLDQTCSFRALAKNSPPQAGTWGIVVCAMSNVNLLIRSAYARNSESCGRFALRVESSCGMPPESLRRPLGSSGTIVAHSNRESSDQLATVASHPPVDS
jgi:hypothetical protein